MLHPMFKLYGDPRSGNTRKVRWALEELGRPYELHTVVLAKREHKQPEFLKLNPNGKVPVIDDDGFVLWESDAILWYLGGKLVPESPRERALVHQWMSWNAAHLYPHTYGPRIMRVTAERMGTTYDQKVHDDLLVGAGPLLKILEQEVGDYLVGNSLTIADLSVVLSVNFGKEEGIDLAPFPKVTRWWERLIARPAWQKIQPPPQ
jgi:glutathione S-transferase